MFKEQKRVLVVDDDKDIREIIMRILGSEGYAVSGLDNGHAVVETVEQTRPNIILLDVMLGDMDGRDICKQLKSQPQTNMIPIIMVSATHGFHTRHEKQCKADGYVSKPFDVTDLVDHVKRYAA